MFDRGDEAGRGKIIKPEGENLTLTDRGKNEKRKKLRKKKEIGSRKRRADGWRNGKLRPEVRRRSVTAGGVWVRSPPKLRKRY